MRFYFLLIIILLPLFFLPSLSNAQESSDVMVVNPETNKIYLFNENNKTISVIDGNNNKLLANIHLEGKKSNILSWSMITNNIPIIGTLAGIITVIIGLFTYGQSQTIKKKDIQKEIVFPLIDEFDNKSPNTTLAKLILDDVKIKSNDDNYAYGQYNVDRLKKVLAYHEKKGNEPWDKGDGYVRSFDALLDFFVRLEYLQSIGLLTKKEINYFRYYIDRAAENPAVVNYIKEYKFPLNGKLNTKLKL